MLMSFEKKQILDTALWWAFTEVQEIKKSKKPLDCIAELYSSSDEIVHSKNDTEKLSSNSVENMI